MKTKGFVLIVPNEFESSVPSRIITLILPSQRLNAITNIKKTKSGIVYIKRQGIGNICGTPPRKYPSSIRHLSRSHNRDPGPWGKKMCCDSTKYLLGESQFGPAGAFVFFCIQKAKKHRPFSGINPHQIPRPRK